MRKARSYCIEWALGVNRFDRKREHGSAQGWIRHGLWLHDNGEDFSGEFDAHLRTRRSANTFVLDVKHRDSRIGAEFWHIVMTEPEACVSVWALRGVGHRATTYHRGSIDSDAVALIQPSIADFLEVVACTPRSVWRSKRNAP